MEISSKSWLKGLEELGMGRDVDSHITVYSKAKGWKIESSEILLNQPSHKEAECFEAGKLMHYLQ